MKVLNHDIASLVKRLRRFKKEMVKSVSSNVSAVGEHDLKRLNSYLEAIKAFKNWMISQPSLDMPETSPREIDLGVDGLVFDMENDDLGIIVDLMNTIEMELVNSQSSRIATGLIQHDSLRFDTYVSKIEKFLTDFVATNNPLDLPETAPSAAVTGAGSTGI